MSLEQTKRRVGILGGMGPEATVLLMRRVIDLTSACDDSDHVPLIVDNNTEVPSRIKAIVEKNGADPAPVLATMARNLEACGAKALAMPCNTAHHYASFIEGAVHIPFLNMIEMSAQRVSAMTLTKTRVGLLASPAVQSTGIFDRAFSRVQIETLYPGDPGQMLDAIRCVKVDSADRTARQTLDRAARELMDNGADVLLVACSELSIIADAIPNSFPRVDTIDVLAKGIVEFSGAKLRAVDEGQVM